MKRLFLMVFLTLVLVALSIMPAFAVSATIRNIADTYTITARIPVKNLDNTYITRLTTGTLVISDNTTSTRGVISNATATFNGYTVALVGFVGAGDNPKISLVGSDGQTVVNFNGSVRNSGATIYSISGRMDGWIWHGSGTLHDDPVGATAAFSVADSKTGSVSVLLTAVNVLDGSIGVDVTPPAGIHLHDIDTITSGWSVYHRLQDTKPYGIQLELRFLHPYNVNPDGAGHVDVTLLLHQEAGDNTWELETVNSATTLAGYYGNDPWDATAFDEFSGTLHLADIEAAINEEAAMTANGGFTCGDWVLSRVRVELWETGARTCYVDDLTINGTTYNFEPVQFGGSFKAIP